MTAGPSHTSTRATSSGHPRNSEVGHEFPNALRRKRAS
jgi:hypothetical protein